MKREGASVVRNDTSDAQRLGKERNLYLDAQRYAHTTFPLMLSLLDTDLMKRLEGSLKAKATAAHCCRILLC